MRLDKDNQSITFIYREHRYLAPFMGLAIFFDNFDIDRCTLCRNNSLVWP
ncbi:hypothetical protein GCM10007161_06390 [Ignatzschineria indica]|nr:hypothetical protein GCM10007161_06390 [Ignatzschineria indica]